MAERARISEWYASNGSLRTTSSPPSSKSSGRQQMQSLDDDRPSSWRTPPGSAQETRRSKSLSRSSSKPQLADVPSRDAHQRSPTRKPENPQVEAWSVPVKCIEAWPEEPVKRTEAVCYAASKILDLDGKGQAVAVVNGYPVHQDRSRTCCGSMSWQRLAVALGFLFLFAAGMGVGVFLAERPSPSTSPNTVTITPDDSPSSETAELPVPQVAGVLELQVEDADSFIHDPRAARAIKSCIGKKLAVDEDSVQLNMKRSGRLLRGSRNLASQNVLVDYTIILGAAAEASDLVEQIAFIQPVSMSSQLASDLQAEGLDDLVQVVRMTGSLATTTTVFAMQGAQYALQVLTSSSQRQSSETSTSTSTTPPLPSIPETAQSSSSSLAISASTTLQLRSTSRAPSNTSPCSTTSAGTGRRRDTEAAAFTSFCLRD